MEYAGHDDDRESSEFWTRITGRHGLTPVHQQYYTHMTTSSVANFDRFYVNHHPFDQIDHTFHCTTLEWHKDLSDHRPIRLTKKKHT